ncbi:MAG: hypothetical protein CMJ90_18490 [Planctomycetes bacterium]|nr:hypothetical protein [Planctomycetota bacterium]
MIAIILIQTLVIIMILYKFFAVHSAKRVRPFIPFHTMTFPAVMTDNLTKTIFFGIKVSWTKLIRPTGQLFNKFDSSADWKLDLFHV